MYAFPPPNPNGNDTPSLILGFYGSVDISRDGGGVFNLNQFDMAISWYDPSPSRVVDVTAFFHNGTTSTQTLTLIQGLQTHLLNLYNVDRVNVTAMDGEAGYWLMDNVVYDESGVPEPATWALFLGGLGAIALLRHR
jgi:hypothetical protein